MAINIESDSEDIPESEYLPEIWGDAMVNEAAFARQPILQVFVSLITRYRDAIAHTLRTGAVYTPLLLQNEGRGCLWERFGKWIRAWDGAA